MTFIVRGTNDVINILDPGAPGNLPAAFDYGAPDTPPPGQWVTKPAPLESNSSALFEFDVDFGSSAHIDFEAEFSNDGGNTWRRVPRKVAGTGANPDRTEPDGSLIRARAADWTSPTVGDKRVVLPTFSVQDAVLVRWRAIDDGSGDASISAARSYGGLDF